MQKLPKKTQKSPHPFGHLPASYRPATGQLSASYKKTEDANVSFLLPIEDGISIEPTSNLRRTYVEPTPNLRRIYIEPTSGTIGRGRDVFFMYGVTSPFVLARYPSSGHIQYIHWLSDKPNLSLSEQLVQT